MRRSVIIACLALALVLVGQAVWAGLITRTYEGGDNGVKFTFAGLEGYAAEAWFHKVTEGTNSWLVLDLANNIEKVTQQNKLLTAFMANMPWGLPVPTTSEDNVQVPSPDYPYEGLGPWVERVKKEGTEYWAARSESELKADPEKQWAFSQAVSPSIRPYPTLNFLATGMFNGWTPMTDFDGAPSAVDGPPFTLIGKNVETYDAWHGRADYYASRSIRLRWTWDPTWNTNTFDQINHAFFWYGTDTPSSSEPGNGFYYGSSPPVPEPASCALLA
ncbi:MAG: hypothetical protein ACUVX8_02785 [Candidatus Zipacnadales bacterium]